MNEQNFQSNKISSRVPMDAQTRQMGISGEQQASDNQVLDLAGFVRVLSVRRKLIYLAVLCGFLLAGLACGIMTPRYKSVARVELLRQEQGVLATPTSENQTAAGASQAEDSLNFSLTLQTAVEVLTSDELALQVIHELNLENDPDFKFDPIIQTDDTRREQNLPLAQAPLRRTYVLKKWNKRLKVVSSAGTRILEISFKHRDPQVAAKIVNQLVKDYINYRYEARYKAAQKSVDWLQAKLGNLKTEAEESGKHMAELEKAAGTYGNDESGDHNLIVARLEQLNLAVAAAQGTRAEKEVLYKLASTGDPELVAGIMSNGSLAGGAMITGQPSFIVALRQQESDLNAQLAESSAKYGPEHPKILELKKRRDAIRDDIKTESQKILARARQEYLAATQAEMSARKALEEEKRLAEDMNEKTTAFNMAKQEAVSSQQFYQAMLAASKETAMLAGVHSTDINIVDNAAPEGKPSTPNVPLFIGAGIAVGLIFGVVLAFVVDALDLRLRDPEMIEQLSGLPLLGIIPRSEGYSKSGRKKKTSHQELAPGICNTSSTVMEAFRAARSSLLLSRPDNPHRVFLVTSPLPTEGKSFSSSHLATVLSQAGGKVLLVDADLRRGSLSRSLKRYSRVGLSSLVAGESKDEDVFRAIDEIPGLTFLPSGATPPTPVESLGSKKMAQLIEQWKEKFDYIVFDTAPIMPVTDAAVLSQYVDGVLVMVRPSVSTKKTIQHTVRILQTVHAECFGIMINAVDIRPSEYGHYGYYGYYGTTADAADYENGKGE